MAEPVGATAATGTITVASQQLQAGTIDLYIAGHHVAVNLAQSDTINMVATEIAAAINSLPYLPVIATATAAICTLSCKWKGITGNEISMMDSYFGKLGGELLPPGLALTYSNVPVGEVGGVVGFLAGGVGTPVFDTAIANLGEDEYEFVTIGGYTDSTSLRAWEYEYGFSDNGRWGWMRQLYGHVFAAKRGLYSDLINFGLNVTFNSGTMSIMGFEITSPHPSYEWAAAYAAKAALALIIDPARPLQTLHL
jgi:phage tail sheath gpL-like